LLSFAPEESNYFVSAGLDLAPIGRFSTLNTIDPLAFAEVETKI
jgi:hypothetical protein